MGPTDEWFNPVLLAQCALRWHASKRGRPPRPLIDYRLNLHGLTGVDQAIKGFAE